MNASLLVLLATTLVSVHAQCVTPALETFDAETRAGSATCTSTSIGTLPAGWSQDPTATANWLTWGGTTSSSLTGPNGDRSDPAGNYLYIETSSPCSTATDTAILVSPCFDVSGFAAPTLFFYRNMRGSDIGTLVAEESDGMGGWIEVGRWSGDEGAGWKPSIAALSAPMGESTIRIVATHSGTGFDGDIGLDDIVIQDGPPAVRWQENSANASLVIPTASPIEILEMDGGSVDVRSVSGCAGAVTISESGQVVVSADASAGQFYEIGYNFSDLLPLTPPQSLVTADGDIVNLDVFGGGLGYVFGGFYPAARPLPGQFLPGSSGASVTHGFEVTSAANVSLQGYVTNPAALLGLTLTGAAQFEVEANFEDPFTASISLLGDDTVTNIDLTAAPFCNESTVSFFGGSATEFAVGNNGRVGESGMLQDFSPSVAESLSSPAAFLGAWTDLNVNVGGSITVTQPMANVLNVAYAGVAYFGTADFNSFSVALDANAGTLTLDGLSGILVQQGVAGDGADMFLGLTGGSANGATDAGPTAFAPATMGAGAAATDMLYDFYDSTTGPGFAAALTAGVNSITFTWNGTSYDWSAN